LYQSIERVFAFCSKGEEIHHAAKKKGHANTRSTIGEGNDEKKRQSDDRSIYGERDA
jgi:hypothetical protein